MVLARSKRSSRTTPPLTICAIAKLGEHTSKKSVEEQNLPQPTHVDIASACGKPNAVFKGLLVVDWRLVLLWGHPRLARLAIARLASASENRPLFAPCLTACSRNSCGVLLCAQSISVRIGVVTGIAPTQEVSALETSPKCRITEAGMRSRFCSHDFGVVRCCFAGNTSDRSCRASAVSWLKIPWRFDHSQTMTRSS